ncbi:MAG: YHYH protein [Bacteroidia bacterium]|nr:YHYH protein [Bacteroidia bacterium]MCF8427863.1 YHYH protein [Bacteroidia bacterium]MCF8446612.1 YHYH protein [Bacteroidia bacterium]
MPKKPITLLALVLLSAITYAQTNPAILNWMQNTTGLKGRHYVKNNSTPIDDADSANVLGVYYSASSVYIRANGVPSYITGPFLDGNPSVTTSQNAIFKFTLNPAQKTGTPTATTGGNIGLFINGVALFDYRDGVSWKNSTGTMAGGPSGGMGDNVWNRDAIVAERAGFDCSKGHPAMGNYHHHQNPSAFKLDAEVVSTICNLYDADGLYVIDSTKHSPLIGFAYDGFPIYGAYAYKNADGTGGIIRMKSSYQLRDITVRNKYANGNTVTAGPDVSTTYPLGLFREDYEYIATSASTPDFLDEHNGRFCKTPEYPEGIYCYFATVDSKWNSAYPYVVGPTFYGMVTQAKVTSITEPVTQYKPSSTGLNQSKAIELDIRVFPNPASELVAIQSNDLTQKDLKVELFDLSGRQLQTTTIYKGSTIAYFDTRTLYNGEYIIRISNEEQVVVKKLMVTK